MHDQSSVQDISRQEDDIFQELHKYEFLDEGEPISQSSGAIAREKARRQLALSNDSPFRQLEEDNQMKLEQAKLTKDKKSTMLLDETRQLRSQMDALKQRLTEVRETAKERARLEEFEKAKARFRPLTGKTDCPNCVCDRRRSVCDFCTSLAVGQNGRFARTKWTSIENPDERPIRPAQNQRLKAKVEAVQVNHDVVPNQVYTISRSLDDKRSKLAKAIDELQLTIEKMREQSERLEKDRKLVQIYKNQWKFGPSIGGPRASSRERLGNTNLQQKRDYESRHDANLKRDCKSLMGFKHIGADLKLRQYNQIQKRTPIATRPNSLPVAHFRSKSLDTLSSSKAQDDSNSIGNNSNNNNFDRGQSSSELNLAEKEPAEEVEEQLELEGGSPVQRSPVQAKPEVSERREEEEQEERVEPDSNNVQKMSWVPVFGETEVKTVRSKTPKRKLTIISPSKVEEKQTHSSEKGNKQAHKSILTLNNRPGGCDSIQDRLIVEAQKKLKFASGLLAREEADSRTKNQLHINRRAPVPRPRQRTAIDTTAKQLSVEPKGGYSSNKWSVESELGRLEEMVNEQQRLLNSLASKQSQPSVVSPITVSCASPCCHKVVSPSASSSESIAGTKSSLIISLKDRLNKTKLRLARRLEEERQRHEQLQLKVDSSLRKQTDLETENKLLKKSLDNCIDTCLNDISSTFESLSNTLSTSIGRHNQQHQQSSGDLGKAAQLINDNRYLRQLQSHVDELEQQRRDIFEELSKEKQRAQQLELELNQSRAEMESFRLRQMEKTADDHESRASEQMSHKQQVNEVSELESLPSCSMNSSSEVYKQFIESITPDMEAIRRERRIILDEFDSIRKLLTNLEPE